MLNSIAKHLIICHNRSFFVFVRGGGCGIRREKGETEYYVKFEKDCRVM